MPLKTPPALSELGFVGHADSEPLVLQMLDKDRSCRPNLMAEVEARIDRILDDME